MNTKKTFVLFAVGKHGYVRVCFNTDFSTVLKFARDKYGSGKSWFITDSMVYGRGVTLVKSKGVSRYG